MKRTGSFCGALHSAKPLRGVLLSAAVSLALAPTALLAQSGVSAQSAAGMALPQGGWYGGLSTGQARNGLGGGVLHATGSALTNLADEDASAGYKLFGGYRFSRNIAFEGGYVDLSKSGAQRQAAAPAFGFVPGDVRMGGFYMGAVGIVPLPNRFSLFGKLGTGYATSTAPFHSSGAMPALLSPADLGPKRTEWNSKYGLGASYEMPNKLGLRFEYERINSFGDGRMGEGNVGVWSLGLTKRY